MCVCVPVCHRSHEGGLQHFRLSATVSGHHSALAVWQDVRIISEDGGSERGSRMEESKGEKGREGQ